MRAAGAASAAALTPAPAAAAAAGLKGMMPLPGADGRMRPFLDFVLHELAEAGFTRVGLIVAPEGQATDPLRTYYQGDGRPTRLSVSFIDQVEPRGTADAVWSAAAFVGDAPFVVLNADNLYGTDVLQSLYQADGPALPVYERDQLVASSAIPRDRVAAFALVTLGPDGRLRDVQEKPGPAVMDAAGPRALISMNCWRGDRGLLEACRDVEVSPRGEYELPNAVRLAVQRGVRFTGIPAQGPVLDLSRRDDVETVVERLKGLVPRP